MYPNQGGNNGSGSDSWSIPKKKSSLDASIPRRKSGGSNSNNNNDSFLNQPPSSSMAIPRKPKQHPASGNGSFSSAIPRKPSFTGSIPRRNSGSSSQSLSMQNAIPRRNSGSGMSQSAHSRSSNSHQSRPPGQNKRLSFKIPLKNRSEPPKVTSHSKSSSSNSHGNASSSAYQEQLFPSRQQPQVPSFVSPNILSERPFTISIDMRGVDLTKGGIPRAQPRMASTKRKKAPVIEYKELGDTESEAEFTDSDDDDFGSKKTKKKSISKKIKTKKKPQALPSAAASQTIAAATASGVSAYQQIQYLGPSVVNVGDLPASTWLELGNNSFESPPTGSVSSLWYSREVFLNTYVVEKILAWKTRPTTQLEWDPDTYTDETKPFGPPIIDSVKAAKFSATARSCPLIWKDPKKRNEVSRIVPDQCPIVMAMAVEAQHKEDEQTANSTNQAPQDASSSNGTLAMDISTTENDAMQIQQQSQDGGIVQNGTQQSQLNNSSNGVINGGGVSKKMPSKPRYRIKPTPATGAIDREEVYLIKWRGKSYMHASWERGSDIIRMDQTNNTARHKMRKYLQAQELAFGLNWRRVLEEERKINEAAHVHGNADNNEAATNADSNANDEEYEEEYYPPANTEIERILGCDESEMDLSLYAKQRALNILDEQEQEKKRENGTVKKWNSKEGLKELLTELPWDPEDNVRYVVKWKGLPFAEMTWEYWKDIKTEAADEVEDFWIRQQPPDDEILERNSQPHPHIKDFRKIQESPPYGLSERKRAVADAVDGRVVPKEEEDESANGGFRLRNYQLEGVNWLLFNWWNRRSCILADEMGLGKTIQSVGFIKLLQDLPNTGVRGPFLIVAPLSLIGQWQSEMKSWAPDLNIVLYHGSAEARDFLVKNDFFFTDQFVSKGTANRLRKQHVTKFHILITTYEVVLKDVEVFTKIKWKALIVDEAHRLKNSSSKLFEELSSVPRDYCLLLTGTPLANATEELWALLKFANRSVFDSKEEFLEKFGQLTDSGQVDQLHAVLKPYLLRRVKEDVEKSMPPKTETILEVSLTPSQKKFYKAIYERNTTFLFKGAKPKNQPSLMNVMMELRKCCNHPFLIRGAEDKLLGEAAEQMRSNNPESKVDNVKVFHDQLVKSSGKMVLINKLLPKLFANGHKVLIFSQMVRVLDLLEELLKMMRYKYERLDGSTRSSSRAAAVDRFIRKSCQRFVMLLSTRAGGLGLNLTAADIVIIYDSDWNPQNDLQAMARAHRIGQTKAVSVYRLLTAKTYEMHMFHSASMKLGLEQAVLSQQRDQGENGEGKKSKSKSEREAQAKKIDQLLKKGAYDVFRDDDDEEAKKFMETDIDQLMASSAKDVTYGKQKNNLSSGLGSFSKASFVTDTGDGEKDVDLDDPDFWSKAVGLDKPTETPEEISHMIDDGVKRSRKQVEQFDPYADIREEERVKQERLDMKLQAEKEERDRLREEKRAKKSDKSKKKKTREEREAENKEARTLPPPPNSLKKRKKVKSTGETEVGKKSSNKKMLPITKKDASQLSPPPQKKSKRSLERKRALMKAENENPTIENLKQAWEVTHRNRAVAACIRFGFSRFTKIRHESNLQWLPIQDIEIFFRQFFYQQSLQLSLSFMQLLNNNLDGTLDKNLKTNLQEFLGQSTSEEIEWISDCIVKGMQHYLDIENNSKNLRLPSILAEGSYLSALRRGAALRSLRRIYMACRVQKIVHDCVDGIVEELGYEQLAQRGCSTSNVSTLDVDMKARLVSTEELTLSLNMLFSNIDHKSPATWWDRSCDIALLLGTFVHGLGNYEAMVNDDTLPFVSKISKYAKSDLMCCDAQSRFLNAAIATKKVCDDALEASKLKAQKEVQKAVAAAAAASLKREKEAAALREGGVAADAVISNMGEQPMDHLYEIKEGKDDHFVTLPRLKRSIESSVRSSLTTSSEDKGNASKSLQTQKDTKGTEDIKGRRKRILFDTLPMPDARVLDFRLKLLVTQIERNVSDRSVETSPFIFSTPKVWPASETVLLNQRMRDSTATFALKANLKQSLDQTIEYAGIGLNGTQCGVTHRTVDDRTDFSIGAASPDLHQVAHGPESPRYLRALGVPMTFSRFGLVALIHAEEQCLNRMLENEQKRFYSDDGKKEVPNESKEANKPIETNQELKLAEHTESAVTGKESNELQIAKVGISVEGESMGPKKTNLATISVPAPFQDNAALRAGVTSVLLYFGYPFFGSGESKDSSQIPLDQLSQTRLFGEEQFETLLQSTCGDANIPQLDIIKEYIDGHFLPHCLKLCLYGNSSITHITRGSKGEYETPDGISTYPEPTEKLQSPFPDPCLPLSEQSMEAVGVASAILRRVRLMRCIHNISSGKIQNHKLQKILHSRTMRKSMSGLPVWWCPWIHDAALLAHASTRGLFSILRDLDSESEAGPVFSRQAILQHIRSSLFADASTARSIQGASSPDESAKWIESYANEFPSLNAIERRLAFLCVKLTEDLENESRFDNLPMYDHGGWPRN